MASDLKKPKFFTQTDERFRARGPSAKQNSILQVSAEKCCNGSIVLWGCFSAAETQALITIQAETLRTNFISQGENQMLHGNKIPRQNLPIFFRRRNIETVANWFEL